MGLKHDDFQLTEEQLDRLNTAIDEQVAAFYHDNPDVDPPDAMTVRFNFVFGFGRSIDVRVGGLIVEVDLMD